MHSGNLPFLSCLNLRLKLLHGLNLLFSYSMISTLLPTLFIGHSQPICQVLVLTNTVSTTSSPPPSVSGLWLNQSTVLAQLSTQPSNFRKMNYTHPQTHVNKMKKFQIYSSCLQTHSPSSGRIKRTSKKPEFQLNQCDHPRDARTFLWLVRCTLWTV